MSVGTRSIASRTIYGSPTDEVLEQMREIAGSGASVTISPPVLGFDRFDAS